ncbi:MAG: hypothetical protein KJ646_01545 [Nanoarchaeota archaeon]|nr:hypothetical protein [Nanoarchaeota archaeon]MBU4116927.1 hypothetical protein [Nanoarchaeota archaeon]
MKKNQSCCPVSKKTAVIGHVLFIAGIYLLTWGLIKSASLVAVLKSPIFWGLVVLGIGKCVMMADHKHIMNK